MSETEKSQVSLRIGSKLERFKLIWQNIFFYQYSQPFYDVLQKEKDYLDFFKNMNFEFVDSLKNNEEKYLLFIGGSCN